MKIILYSQDQIYNIHGEAIASQRKQKFVSRTLIPFRCDLFSIMDQ